MMSTNVFRSEFRLRVYGPVTMHHRRINMCTKSHIHDTHVEFGSESFEEFLSILGEKIRLRGWERFRGGLDVKGKIIRLNFFFIFLLIMPTEIGFDLFIFKHNCHISCWYYCFCQIQVHF